MGRPETADETRGPIAGLLLSGGTSRRLGRDKAAVTLGGERLVDRAARLLGAVAEPVLEVGPGYTDLRRVDEGPERRGPLAAVAAGVAFLGNGRDALVLAVDMPHVTAALLRGLAVHPSIGNVVPVDARGHLQVLCARYCARALSVASGLVDGGHRAMTGLVDAAPTVLLTPEEWSHLAPPDAFEDVDTPADLARLDPPT